LGKLHAYMRNIVDTLILDPHALIWVKWNIFALE